MQLTTPRLLAAIAGAAIALSVIGSFPALSGSAVYDDEILPAGAFTDELADVGRTFWLTSLDYRRRVEAHATDVAGVTYRPTTMATLILTDHLGGSMKAHHLVSLFLHALTAFLVGAVLVRAGRPAWLAALASGVVAAHPALIEAWVWVAGRADLVAGLALATVALAIPARLERATKLGYVVGALALVVGTLAKETFVFVGPLVAMRGVFVSGAPRGGRFATIAIALLSVSVLGLAWQRIRAETMVVPEAGDVLIWLRRAPRMLGDATTTVLIPYHRAMRSVAFEMQTPVSAMTLLGSAGFGLAFAASLSEKKFGLALGLVGIAVSLIVASHVGDHFWLGFDRFLYVPVVALAILVGEAWEGAPESLARPTAIASAVVVVGLAFLAHLGAKAYASQISFETALKEERPSDPSGILLEARRLVRSGREESAARALEHAAPSTSPAIERERALRQFNSGRQELAIATLARMERTRPEDPMVAADALTVAVARRNFVDVPRYAEIARSRLAARRIGCITLATIRRSAPGEAAADTAPIREGQQILRCDAFDR